ncbi:MAG: PrsW family intramembrane metalloprotease [Thermoplasmatota archaeon]
MNQETILTALILVGAAFIPSLIYLWWMRNAEKIGRQRWSNLFKTFTWGAIFAVIIAVILSLLFSGFIFSTRLQREYQFLGDKTIQSLILVCVIAPLVEEFAKVLGVFSVRSRIYEIEDGLVFGAACGLGFAATENLLYESNTFFTEGFGTAFITIVIVRSIASSLLHGSASAMAGYGVSKGIFKGKNSFIPYYLLAVFMHGSFNFLASIDQIFDGSLPLLALIAAFIFSITAIRFVRGKIIALDRRS